MKHFLIKIFVGVLIVLAIHMVVGRYADGTTDEFYLRFTGNKKSAMILGTSRAAQGLIPSVMDAILAEGGIQHELFNFSFTIAHSPIGPTYLRAIQAKLDPDTRDGLFVLTIDPWALSDQTDPDGSTDGYPEDDHLLGEQCTFNSTPNYEYLARWLQAGWGSLLSGPLHDLDTISILHEDGWLEVRIAEDEAKRQRRTEARVSIYRKESLPGRVPTQRRIDALNQMITFLKEHGEVLLVRLPVGVGMTEMENEFWPSMSEEIQAIALKHDLVYWDLVPDQGRYEFTDGNHVTVASAHSLSEDLAKRISADAAF